MGGEVEFVQKGGGGDEFDLYPKWNYDTKNLEYYLTIIELTDGRKFSAEASIPLATEIYVI